MTSKVFLEGLEIKCIIGIFDWERKKKQKVIIDFDIPININKAAKKDSISDALDYKAISKRIISFVSKSKFHLIETLAKRLATLLIDEFRLPAIFLRVSKPGAIRGSRNVGIEVRLKAFMKYLVSLGSNVSPDIHIPKALQYLEKKFQIIKKSSIYETNPFGPAGPKVFWNCVVQIEANQTQQEMKEAFRSYELENGRTRNPKDKYSERTIDLDLLPQQEYQNHPFVMIPLAEILPDDIDGETNKSFETLAHELADQAKSYKRVRLVHSRANHT